MSWSSNTHNCQPAQMPSQQPSTRRHLIHTLSARHTIIYLSFIFLTSWTDSVAKWLLLYSTPKTSTLVTSQMLSYAPSRPPLLRKFKAGEATWCSCPSLLPSFIVTPCQWVPSADPFFFSYQCVMFFKKSSGSYFPSKLEENILERFPSPSWRSYILKKPKPARCW